MADPQGTVLGVKAVEQLQKTVREVSRRIRNEMPHRGRWHGRPSTGEVELIEGLVLACVGNGWYEVQLATWDREPDEIKCSGKYVVDESDECDPCVILGLVPTNPDQPCTTKEVSIDYDRPTGIGGAVYAHDTRRVPLKIGGHVRMLPTHRSECGDQLYAIITGEYKLLAIAEPDYECCDGQVVQTGCKFYVVEGVECKIYESDCAS